MTFAVGGLRRVWLPSPARPIGGRSVVNLTSDAIDVCVSEALVVGKLHAHDHRLFFVRARRGRELALAIR